MNGASILVSELFPHVLVSFVRFEYIWSHRDNQTWTRASSGGAFVFIVAFGLRACLVHGSLRFSYSHSLLDLLNARRALFFSAPQVGV